ncbi:substrate of the Dot/Icm secretion system, LepB-like [Legionella wadsworthii]|uniref:Substrate of the Dot/Icm secretion system, LepB-like n=1 Tax=Legionella wadsworthii TaxID=28088 RepID=A0A378LVJ2_9GAMM|nr:LepB GTPase-activating domain-containing protein [Legionella wadsworthii]STY29859.1 substrate of the Dot/Icm secretion system, LepB-like [Legionella wadsworthii]
MIIYKGKVLTKFKNKKGGKNQSEVDGFYRNPEGLEYFIKKPKDQKELFTELFAGLLLQEFIHRGFIERIYHASFVYAELIQFEDGSYGLIQPKIEFKELFKIIGTGYRDGSDRDPLVEMFYGPQSYLILTQLKSYFGLAIALMYSLLFGDHSVHSGNVVCLDVLSSVEMMFIQFARIDWGAAFRFLAHSKNNEDLLYPFEYQGWFNHKGYTKGYFLNYRKIKGLFPAIAEQAGLLAKKVDTSILTEIVDSALQQVPKNLLDYKSKKELAHYMCIQSFETIDFGESHQPFALDLADVLLDRLKKILVLKDMVNSEEPNSQQMSYIESLPSAIGLFVNHIIPFQQQMSIWLNTLSLSDERSIFDFNCINRTLLAQKYNPFIECLARQVALIEQFSKDQNNVYVHDEIKSRAITKTLMNLFSLDMDLKPGESDMEQRIPFKQPCWRLVEALLSTSFNIVITIRVMQSTQSTSMLTSASAIHFLFDALKKYLHDFNTFYETLIHEIQHTLFSMSGFQIARICLYEMEYVNSSLLIGLVLKNSDLWERMNSVFSEENEQFSPIEMERFTIKLRQLHADYSLFLTLSSELASIDQHATKYVVLDKLKDIFESLPEVLQSEIAPTLNQIQDGFRKEQRRFSIHLEELNPVSEQPYPNDNDEDVFGRSHKLLLSHEMTTQGGELHERILADKVLWHSIIESENGELPLDDLFVLKNFYDRKKEEWPEAFREPLNIFYTRAIKMRLSERPLHEQARALTRDAGMLFKSSVVPDILKEVIFLIQALYVKGTILMLQTTNKALFFNQHQAGASLLMSQPNDDCLTGTNLSKVPTYL